MLALTLYYVARAPGTRLQRLTWHWCVVSAICMAVGYAIYLTLYLSGGVAPNPTTWCLWALGGLVEAWCFRTLVKKTRRDVAVVLAEEPKTFWKWFERNVDPLELPAWMCAFFAVIVAAIGLTSAAMAYYNGIPLSTAFTPPDTWEWMVAGGDVLVVAVYAILRISTNDRVASKVAITLMVIDIFLSFLPIWYSTYHDPASENALPWVIWALGSYGLTAAATLVNPGHDSSERPWLLIYPVTSALFHGAVGGIIIFHEPLGRIVSFFT